MIVYACYNSDIILTSGKITKKEVLHDLLHNLYILLLEDKKEELGKISYADMYLKGIGKFKGLLNMQKDEKNREIKILSRKVYTLDDKIYVGQDYIFVLY